MFDSLFHKKWLLFFTFVSCTLLQAQGQASVLESYIRHITAFSSYYPQEKVYLHFDNTGYYQGEIIRFQSYVVQATDHHPTGHSKTLYVEFLSARGDMVTSQKLKIENGRAPGEITLRDTLKAGYYEVRAYTRSMLNFGDECIFSRVFPVFNKPGKDGVYPQQIREDTYQRGTDGVTRGKEKYPSKINVSFYPEGGELVEGLPSKVAFKAVGSKGENIHIEGVIYSSSGEIVTGFSTMDRGMGFFELPAAGNGFTAKVFYDNKQHVFPLPECRPSGYGLRVGWRGETLTVHIAKTPDSPPETIGLCISCRGKVYLSETVDMQAVNRIFRIDGNRFPPGVCQITLFNTDGHILAERLFFSWNKPDVAIAQIPSDSALLFRVASSSGGISVPAGLSVSVRDMTVEPNTGYTGNIMTELLLASDLKGYIEDPAWYFEKEDAQRRTVLDLLMLTQGWRRYNWEVMAGAQPFRVTQGMEKQLLLEGSVLDIRERPQAGVEVTMWMYSGKGLSQHGSCLTDSAGRFNFAVEEFYGTWNLSLQTKVKDKRKQYLILLDRHFRPVPRPFGNRETTILPPRSLVTTNQSVGTIQVNPPDTVMFYPELDDSVRRIKEVEIRAKRIYRQELEAIRYANIAFDIEKEADHLTDKGQYKSGLFLDFLADIAPFSWGVEHNYNAEDGYTADIVYRYKSREVAFVADNNMGVGSPLSELLTEEVKSVYIDEDGLSAVKYGISKTVVVIFIYTNMSERRRTEPRGIRNTYMQGYNRPGGSYIQDYTNKDLPAWKLCRRTLYWNPAIMPDSSGIFLLRFPTNSRCGDIKVNIETMTGDGIPVAAEYILKKGYGD